MGLRFRQRVKICPGLYVNIGLGGVSMTAGVRGASITLGPQGTYVNAGIPGTGVSFRQKIGTTQQATPGMPESAPHPAPPLLPSSDEKAIHSADAESVTSAEFAEAKETLLKTYQEQRNLRTEIVSAESALNFAEILRVASYFLLVGLILKWFKANVEQKQARLNELKGALDNCIINLDVAFDAEREAAFKKLESAFNGLASSARTWQVDSGRVTDRFHERTLAMHAIDRAVVQFSIGKVEGLKSSHDPFHMPLTSGSDLFIYPAFFLLRDQEGAIGIVGLREVTLKYHDSKFIEEQGVPSDTKTVGLTWKKTNKDGSPDRRFKGNYKIPVVLYGEFSLESSTGLRECFQISNREATKRFADAFLAYQKAIGSA